MLLPVPEEFIDEDEIDAFYDVALPDIDNNQELTDELNDIDRMIGYHRRFVKPHLVQAVDLRLSGMKFKDIAEKLKLSPQTISAHLKTEDAKNLAILLIKRRALTQSSTFDLRKAMAWRIATRLEQDKPTVALKALEYISRIEGDFQHEQGELTPTVIIQNYQIEQKTRAQLLKENASQTQTQTHTIDNPPQDDFQPTAIEVKQ